MGALLGAAGVLVCVLFVYDLAWEPLLEQSYLDWYVDNGGLVNLVLGLVAIGAKLDERPECISADPDRYFQAWGGLLGDSLSELGRALRRGPGAGGSRSLAVPLLDSALTLVFALVWGPLLLAFLLVIARLSTSSSSSRERRLGSQSTTLRVGLGRSTR